MSFRRSSDVYPLGQPRPQMISKRLWLATRDFISTTSRGAAWYSYSLICVSSELPVTNMTQSVYHFVSLLIASLGANAGCLIFSSVAKMQRWLAYWVGGGCIQARARKQTCRKGIRSYQPVYGAICASWFRTVSVFLRSGTYGCLWSIRHNPDMAEQGCSWPLLSSTLDESYQK